MRTQKKNTRHLPDWIHSINPSMKYIPNGSLIFTFFRCVNYCRRTSPLLLSSYRLSSRFRFWLMFLCNFFFVFVSSPYFCYCFFWSRQILMVLFTWTSVLFSRIFFSFTFCLKSLARFTCLTSRQMWFERFSSDQHFWWWFCFLRLVLLRFIRWFSICALDFKNLLKFCFLLRSRLFSTSMTIAFSSLFLLFAFFSFHLFFSFRFSSCIFVLGFVQFLFSMEMIIIFLREEKRKIKLNTKKKIEMDRKKWMKMAKN